MVMVALKPYDYLSIHVESIYQKLDIDATKALLLGPFYYHGVVGIITGGNAARNLAALVVEISQASSWLNFSYRLERKVKTKKESCESVHLYQSNFGIQVGMPNFGRYGLKWAKMSKILGGTIQGGFLYRSLL